MNSTSLLDSTPQRIDRFRDEYAFLSNFHRAPFRWRGSAFQTAENAFQSAKTRNDRERERIRLAPSPGAAKRLGRRVDLRSDWERSKDDVMHAILQAKFAVPELRDALLATGAAELVEGNSWRDTYWGVCNGVGRNQLGRTLMRIRDAIRRRAAAAMDDQHATWLREHCNLVRLGHCDAAICARRGGWRQDAAGGPSCIPLEILQRLEPRRADGAGPSNHTHSTGATP